MRQPVKVMMAVIAAMLVTGALGGEAWAQACPGSLGPPGSVVSTPTTCTIVGPITAPACPLTLTMTTGDLVIASAGSLKCDDASPASAITIDVQSGNMVMAPGSRITAENTAAAGGVNGGTISITVSGTFTMEGTSPIVSPYPNGCAGVGATGACISSSDVDAGGGKGGNITIKVGNLPNLPPVGVFNMEPGSAVLANSPGGSGGAIVATAGLTMHIEGLVRSFGGIGGTGSGQPNGGGPITLKSGCTLEVTRAGVVSSEGEDPGPDLVHLEGCDVVVNGLVQSIAKLSGGHVVPAAGNKCNDDPVAHPPGGATDFTACVEIWGNNITINSKLINGKLEKGEISANGVTNKRAWIDLLAKIDVAINNDTTGPYSVHANSGSSTNDFGGLITIKAQTGAYESSGLVIQANSLAAGSNGGDVIIQAHGDVDLGDSLVQARGSAAGTNPAGGTISARSFHGTVSGTGLGELLATGGPPLGVITLQGCGTGAPGADGVSYPGTTNPAFGNPGNDCTGDPVLPTAVVNALAILDPICASATCQQQGGGDCPKRGRKFNDIAGKPGLAGWQICAFDSTGTLVGPCAVTAGPNGNYEFPSLTCDQTYTFCEVLQGTWTQTFPAAAGGDVVSCANLVGPGGVPLGPYGYEELLVRGQASEGNDFGNVQDTQCKEDPDAACTLKVGPGGFATVQAAYNAATSPKDVICVFANTTENVVLGAPNGDKSLTITQCTTARVTAANDSLPVWTISSTGRLTIIGPDAQDGSIGWQVSSSGHDIRGVRATGAKEVGIVIAGNNNKVSFNAVSGSPLGVRISGTGNDVRGGTVSGNGAGVQLGATASNNTFSGATVRNNTGVGILVEGSGNLLSGNRVNGNTGANSHGIHVKATGTALKGNQSGNPENGGAEYMLDVDAIDQGSNRADGTTIPRTSSPPKCPTFPAAGTCE